MRILFIGCVQSSAYFLEQMLAHHDKPIGVITKQSSNFNSDFVDLAPICQRWEIPCFYASNINDEDSLAFIAQCRPDLIYCFGWSQLLKSPILKIPPKGVVGFHPAMLPNNRGRHPLIWALALGLSETASSFFLMDENADTGAVISQEKIPILYEDNAESLYKKVLQAAAEQILTFTRAFETDTIQVHPQTAAGNAWRKRTIVDGQIDWRMSSRAIYNLVRALSEPYPGAHFMKSGNMVKVWRTEEVEMEGVENLEPGKVLRVVSPTEFFVKTYASVIHVLECDSVELAEGEYL